ncbi:glycine betaine ABC transporter substrate-binding protein [Pseudanabaena sp. FACHB-2040]|uniref:glycine betaine ABC transporter substrate-binding protein n=1 Tax=Pseudanabaena sp. FACHB-2040 TaxID=2692859 RepID=UPI0016881C2B|nr:glycine betaine ABC transporter substrate-binding protein [Pseudanabaena sp. FACHB-2040]MBD2258645.1 quaternary ammonium transporter [Pseudanabaena sp. FACHB-2040]
MKRSRRWFTQVVLGAGAAVAIAACGGGSSEEVVSVGSKDFTEQLIIGEMYALMLEEAGLTVERKLNLGGTPVAQAAMESGEIDLYPEYTGTGLLTVLKLPPSSDQEAVYNTVSEAYREQFNMVWLDPSPMNNTQALAMTEEKAQALDIRSLSDFAGKADQLVLIGPPEFEVREDGLPGIQEAYGNFTVQEYKAVDPGLRYRGLVDGEADVAVAFGTDGEISAFNLVLLEDDRNLFPPYQVAPVVRQEALDANPGIADALNQLSPLLNDEVMQQLNYEVSGNQREPAEVAREFLVNAGLLSE